MPTSSKVRYQADEHPPNPLAFGLGLQYAVLTIAGIVLTPAIVIRAAGLGDPLLTWAAFAALLVSGITTIVQARRVGRVGAGYILLMGTSGAFIAVCVAALAEGGAALLATLVIASSLFQFLLAWRLSWLRRIITPVVGGTVIMLIAVAVMPIIFGMLKQVSPNAPPAAAPVSALATLGLIMGIVMRGRGYLRLWAPVVGVAGGCVVAGFFGLYDWTRVVEAPWVGVPVAGFRGWDLRFGPAFWALLPAFVFVTVVGAIETVGDAVAIQRVSWRDDRAVDYRSVQGAVKTP